MIGRLLTKSLSNRKSRIAIAILSVIIGAAIATALLTVTSDVSEKVGLEFRKYGANILVVPKSETIEVGFPGVDFGSVTEQRYINESDIWKIKSIYWRNNVLGFAPNLYQVVSLSSNDQVQSVVMVGTYFNKEIEIVRPYGEQDPDLFITGVEVISPWWNIEGEWITNSSDEHQSLVGVNVADTFNLSVGEQFTITYIENYEDIENVTTYNLTVTGIVRTDGNEDNQIFVNLQVAQEITNREGKLHTIQVSALCNKCPVDSFALEIESAIPYAEARTVKQLVSAEMNILTKIQDMMFLVTIVALIASALGVMTTMTTSVIERRKEIGLMKSIGSDNASIITLFLSESAIIGIIGGIIGFLIGIILSQFIGMSVFNTSIAARVEVLPIVIGISMGISLLASLLPVKRATKVEPAIVLRGE